MTKLKKKSMALALPVEDNIDGILSEFVTEEVHNAIVLANSIRVESVDDVDEIKKSKEAFTSLNAVYKELDGRRAEIKKDYLSVTKMIDRVAREVSSELAGCLDHLRANKNFVANFYAKLEVDRVQELTDNNLYACLSLSDSESLSSITDDEFKELKKSLKVEKNLKDKANKMAEKMMDKALDGDDVDSLFWLEGVDFSGVSTEKQLTKELKKVSSLVIKHFGIKALNKNIFQ